MGEQVPLFAGNRGCGVRDRGAVFVEIAKLPAGEAAAKERCIIIRIDGMDTKSNNAVRFTTKNGARARDAAIAKQRARVRLEILAVLGVNATYQHKKVTRVGGVSRADVITSGCHKPEPTYVSVKRLSSGKGLDKGGRYQALKSVIDGIADAFGLVDDRELEEHAVLDNMKCKRGTKGVVLELYFAV